MPTVPLHARALGAALASPDANPLPQLLQTPSGLALLELQGDIRFPPAAGQASTHVGKLVFPLHDPALVGEDDTRWMKRVYLYVGRNQRMAGEVKKLGRPFAVVRKREAAADAAMSDAEATGTGEELEIVEIVRYKILFATRPEPVGGGVEEPV